MVIFATESRYEGNLYFLFRMPIRPQPASKSVSSEKLVKTVLQIMEQGPQPMRDMRPSKVRKILFNFF